MRLPAEGIRSTTTVQAEVAPPAPFSYLPDGVLVTVGEAAVHGALANLQVHSLFCIQYHIPWQALLKVETMYVLMSSICRC